MILDRTKRHRYDDDMKETGPLRHLQQITTSEQREEAADSLAVEVMTVLMAVDGRAADGDMDDSEPSAAWPMLDTMRRVLDEIEARMMDSLTEGRSLTEARRSHRRAIPDTTVIPPAAARACTTASDGQPPRTTGAAQPFPSPRLSRCSLNSSRSSAAVLTGVYAPTTATAWHSPVAKPVARQNVAAGHGTTTA